MSTYRVELEGSVREVYEVEADSEAEAADSWSSGTLVLQESFGCEPVAVRLEDD